MTTTRLEDTLIQRLRLGAPTHQKIASGIIYGTDSYHTLEPETGTTDDLDTITVRDASQAFLVLSMRDSGDTITIKQD